jgi:hypothetical protein
LGRLATQRYRQTRNNTHNIRARYFRSLIGKSGGRHLPAFPAANINHGIAENAGVAWQSGARLVNQITRIFTSFYGSAQ